MSNRAQYLAFVGTRTDGSEGIYSYDVNVETGRLEPLSGTTVPTNPSFFDIHPSHDILYTVNQLEDGSVTALSIDRSTGRLSPIDSHPTLDSRPCHLSVDPEGRFALVAHHTGGSLTVLSIGADGGLSGITDRVTRTGSSVDPERQTRSRPHAVVSGPDGRYWYVPDLGADRISVYSLDTTTGTLRHRSPDIDVRPGSGPRHFVFNPDGQFGYLINELGSSVTVFRREDRTGSLTEIQQVSSLPASFDEHNQAADIHAHPSGSWVYCSNRGHDSIAAFEVDRNTGRLDELGHYATGGTWPRNFAIEPTGAFLYAENQHSDAIVTFRIDGGTGELSPTGDVTAVPKPVCMKIVPKA